MTSLFQTQKILLRFKHARAFAYDMELNSRNLEDRWYPMWDHVLDQLIGDHPNLHIAPQYSLWYLGKPGKSPSPPSITPPPSSPPNRPDKPSRYSTPHPELVHPSLQTSKRQTETSRKARLGSVGITADDLARAGERPRGRSTLAQISALTASRGVSSSGSTDPPSVGTPEGAALYRSIPPLLSPTDPRDGSNSAATVPVADTPSRIPDFVILHTRAIPDETAVSSGKYKITELDIPVIVEVKPYVQRHLVGEGKETAINLVIDEASDQSLEQAASLFLNRPNTTSVVAIVTCGPYWSLSKICPQNIPPETWAELNPSSDYPYNPSNDPDSSSYQPTPLVRWSAIAEIEDAKSVTLLEEVQAALAVFPDDKTKMQAIIGSP